MRKLLTLLLLLMLLLTSSAMAAEKSAYRLADEQGTLLAWLDVPPAVGDVLLTADGMRHRVIAVQGQQAVLREDGMETLPDVPWSARETYNRQCTGINRNYRVLYFRNSIQQ